MRPGSPVPVSQEPGAAPAENGLGPRPFAFEHGHLLAQGEDFQGGVASVEDHGLDVALERMGALGLTMLPVTGRTDVKRLKGVVTLDDIMHAYGVQSGARGRARSSRRLAASRRWKSHSPASRRTDRRPAR